RDLNPVQPDDVINNATTGSCPQKSFCGSDMRAAYYGGAALDGAGQSVGISNFIGTDLNDLTTYYTNAGQVNNVPVTLLSVDGQSTSCELAQGCDDTEPTLDMTQALGMAPNLSSLVMIKVCAPPTTSVEPALRRRCGRASWLSSINRPRR